MHPILSKAGLPCRAFIPAHDVRLRRGDLTCHDGVLASVAVEERPRRDSLPVWGDARRKEGFPC